MTSLTPTTALDFERSGKQVGWIEAPLEQPWRDRDILRLPFCQIANGDGPSVVLMGGNHGDEYEGPLVLGRLIRELDPAAVHGRLWILPAMNLPAVLGQRRESPVDGVNANRIWPGRADGSITERIVHWIDDVLLSRAQVLMDLHTGGTHMELVPMSMTVFTENDERAKASRAAANAFGAPLNVELRFRSDRSTASRRASELGLLVIGAETGGGGPVRPEALDVCWRGVRNTLAHLGVLSEWALPAGECRPTHFTRKWGHQSEVEAPHEGVFVPAHGLWSRVTEDQIAGQLYALDEPARPPETIHFPASGLVVARSAHGGVSKGSVLYWVVQSVP